MFSETALSWTERMFIAAITEVRTCFVRNYKWIKSNWIKWSTSRCEEWLGFITPARCWLFSHRSMTWCGLFFALFQPSKCVGFFFNWFNPASRSTWWCKDAITGLKKGSVVLPLGSPVLGAENSVPVAIYFPFDSRSSRWCCSDYGPAVDRNARLVSTPGFVLRNRSLQIPSNETHE